MFSMTMGKRNRLKRLATLGIFAFVGVVGSIFFGQPAYAQTTTSSTMDMTPLITVIVSIIPVFIMIALLDKLMGKFRG